jgi:hypothetical protein
MAKRKIQEPDKLVKLNETVREYGGMYANWRSGGCVGHVPPEILERLISINDIVSDYLKELK